MAYRSINPFNGEEIGVYPNLTFSDLHKKLEVSQSSYLNWSRLSLEQRLNRVESLAIHLENQRQHLAISATREMGKRIIESLAEIDKCAELCKYYVRESAGFLKPKKVKGHGFQAEVHKMPQGIILGIMPWNFPFWQVFRFAIPNLILGNVVVVKHASNVGGTAKWIEQLFLSVGFPKGVYQDLKIGVNDVEIVIKHKSIRGITLTGSEQAGKNVAILAGKYLKKSVLELGGNNAFVVFADAPIKKTIQLAIEGRLVNSGQSCIAAKRFIIDERIHDDFLSGLLTKLKSIKPGDPILNTTQLGPLARKDLVITLTSQIKNTLKQGANLELEGQVNGNLISPFVITRVKPSHTAFKEELFGPVFSFSTFKEEKMAIQLANDSDFGLGVSLHSSDKDRLKALAPKFDEGSVYINRNVRSQINLPFGGVKSSGYGRELAKEGMLEFANIKPMVY